MAVLSPGLRARVVADPPEREVLRQLLPGLQVVPAADLRTLPADDFVWLWDSQPLQGDLVPVGEPVDPERLASIPPGDPLRLLRVDPELWRRCFEPDVGVVSETSDYPQTSPTTIVMRICCLNLKGKSIFRSISVKERHRLDASDWSKSPVKAQ